MIALIWSALGLQKYWSYLVLGAIVLSMLAVAYLRIRASGAQDEKLKEIERSLAQQKVAADVKTDIHSLNAADARQRLRERWGRDKLLRPGGG